METDSLSWVFQITFNQFTWSFSQTPLSSGVPQESVLSSIFFFIYKLSHSSAQKLDIAVLTIYLPLKPKDWTNYAFIKLLGWDLKTGSSKKKSDYFTQTQTPDNIF